MRPTASTRCPTRSFRSNASAASGDMFTAKVSPENVAPLSLCALMSLKAPSEPFAKHALIVCPVGRKLDIADDGSQ